MENRKQLLHNYLLQADSIKVGEGIIIIPDISGFTEFVSNICIEAGRYIIYELLSTIIEHNLMGMNVSEIEGDAILFYQFGKRPGREEVLRQYEIMLNAFNHKLAQIEAVLGYSLQLSLKLVAHYGEFSEYQIGKFKKLYGPTVVKAHTLLKNSVKSRTYALLTDQLTGADEPSISDRCERDESQNYAVYQYQEN